MSEPGFRLGSWQAFVVVCVFVVAGIVFIIRSAPEHNGGSARSSAAAVAAARDDSLEEAAERELIRASMSLTEVASRGGVPVESLVTELGLPATVSRTDPLHLVMREHRLTLRNVLDARRRVRRRQ